MLSHLHMVKKKRAVFETARVVKWLKQHRLPPSVSGFIIVYYLIENPDARDRRITNPPVWVFAR